MTDRAWIITALVIDRSNNAMIAGVTGCYAHDQREAEQCVTEFMQKTYPEDRYTHYQITLAYVDPCRGWTLEIHPVIFQYTELLKGSGDVDG